MEEIVARSLTRDRFSVFVLGAFACLALILAGVGLYGVVAYVVTQRTNEIGIRIALGASRGRVVRMIVREGTLMTVAGVVLGVVGALGLSRVLGALLFGVSPTDVMTYVVVTAVLGAVALVASGLPALKAAKVDPAVTMRAE